MKRLEFLDGFRGVAIIIAIFYHAFTRWAAIVPYGDSYAGIFNFGQVGIHLFLLISGFVIVMSLETHSGFASFLYKRWLRLFPAMLIATVLIFITAKFFYERPRGIPELNSVVPGLLFIEPSWLKAITGIPFSSLEGSFWSLYVEMKFYIMFGLLFFFLGRTKAMIGLCTLFFISLLPLIIDSPIVNKVLETLSFRHFAWFAGGAFAYLYFTGKEKYHLLFCIAICCCEILRTYWNDVYVIIASFSALLLFLLPIYIERLRSIFSGKFLLFFGFISYPLYLIHENAMISLILKFNKYFGGQVPLFLLPLLAITILSIIAFFIAKYIEPLLKRGLNKFIPIGKHN